MPQELIDKVETALKGFETFKTELAAKAAKFDAFDEKKFDDIQKAIADAVDATQKADAEKAARIAAMEEKQKLLEAALSRPGNPASKTERAEEVNQKATSLFNEFARKGSKDRQEGFAEYVERSKLSDDDRTLLTKAMTVNSDPDGGYLVTPELGGTITTLVRETSPMRQLASVITIGSDSLEYILDNDLAGAGWVGETQARPETSTPTLAKLTINVNEIYAQPKASQKLLDDADVDVEAWLAGKASQVFSLMENTAFLVGDGVLKPRGLLTYPAGTSQSPARQVQQVVSGSGSAFTYDGFINLMSALKEPYQGNASWIVNRLGFGSMLLIKDDNSTPIFNMTYDRNGGRPFTILGAPLYFASDMPTVATNALAAAYGDFKQAYQIVDRTGIRVLRDPYTDKPFIKFYTTKRVGGDVINPEAFVLGKISA